MARSRLNTLGLRKKELEEFLNSIDSGADDIEMRRKFKRRPFREATVPIQLTAPNGGSKSKLIVACRDLSRGGAAFLHSSYVHVGSRIHIALPHPQGGHTVIAGTVVRCIHRSGLIHDVGVKFDEEVNAREFLALDPLSDCFSLESVDTESLSGTVLLVDDSEPDQRLIKHYLRPTGVVLKTLASAEEALEATDSEQFDLIITDCHLPGMGGVALIDELRSRGLQVPIIIATADDSERLRAELITSQANAFLAKPITSEMLLRALAEFLSLDGASNGTSASSGLGADDPNVGLIPEFVRNLQEYAEELANPEGLETERLRSVLVSIKGSAAPMGFDTLEQLARTALDAFDERQSVEDAKKQIDSLVKACKQARA